MSEGPILFYDGACGLCARSVAWVLRHDRRGTVRFAPLQGETYARLDSPGRVNDLRTMVLVDGDGLHIEDEAVLRLLRHVGGIWRAAAALGRIIPRSIRSALYRYVARRRLAWFGPADACVMPSDEDRARCLP